MRVVDIARYTEDSQLVLLDNYKTYNDPQDSLYFGEMVNLPLKFYDNHVSKFYADYSPIHGAILRIIIID